MKAAMISIQPKWCELIASGQKTIEVRKTKPKIDVPFKCYIYETKAKLSGEIDFYKDDCLEIKMRNEQVIGEFVCDGITEISPFVYDYYEYFCSDDFISDACLDEDDLLEYGKGKTLYGWHISDLVIYDKPKEFREFWKADICKHYDGGCDCWHELCGKSQNNDCHCGNIRLTRPPQSWCYVEALEAAICAKT